MVKRIWVIIALFVVLIGTAVFEQVYTDSATSELQTKTQNLQTSIEKQNLNQSRQEAKQLEMFWKDKEIAISLFVDYRDIEQIGKQISLVNSHLENSDFELAMVECNLLIHIIKTFKSTVEFDWQNII